MRLGRVVGTVFANGPMGKDCYAKNVNKRSLLWGNLQAADSGDRICVGNCMSLICRTGRCL